MRAVGAILGRNKRPFEMDERNGMRGKWAGAACFRDGPQSANESLFRRGDERRKESGDSGCGQPLHKRDHHIRLDVFAVQIAAAIAIHLQVNEAGREVSSLTLGTGADVLNAIALDGNAQRLPGQWIAARNGTGFHTGCFPAGKSPDSRSRAHSSNCRIKIAARGRWKGSFTGSATTSVVGLPSRVSRWRHSPVSG